VGRVVNAEDPYRTSLGSDPAEIEAVRRAVQNMARDGGFAERAGDVALALDEVVANAQEHGRPPITVNAWSDGRLVVEVSDHGSGFDYPGVCRSHPPAPFGRRGRGLWIVRQLTDVVNIMSGPSGTVVRFELLLEPQIRA
jgi:anti-sigma regulatory factor (Ser/Thr protein kinase)